jgi:hypothetical protein
MVGIYLLNTFILGTEPFIFISTSLKYTIAPYFQKCSIGIKILGSAFWSFRDKNI